MDTKLQSVYQRFANKSMAAGALFFDERSQILIVNPIYRDDWLIPGGMVEQYESPLQACTREVKEELGLDAQIVQLLCVDYRSKEGKHPDNLQFIFYGGILPVDVIKNIKLQSTELSEHRFVAFLEAQQLLNTKLAQRVSLALEALKQNMTYYSEDSKKI